MTKKLCLVVFLILLSLMPSFAKAEADVLPLSPADLRDMTLESIPPWPEEMVLSGTNRHWQKVLHEGEFVVALYEAMPAVIDIPEPYPYDEYVRVLEGSVILTSSEGERQSYEAGDAFLVPVGWTGTWEMPTRFRELIIVDRKGWEAVESMIATLFRADAESSTGQTSVLPLLTTSLKQAPLDDLPPWPQGGCCQALTSMARQCCIRAMSWRHFMERRRHGSLSARRFPTMNTYWSYLEKLL